RQSGPPHSKSKSALAGAVGSGESSSFHARGLVVNDATDRAVGDDDLLLPTDAGAVLHLDTVGARLQSEAGLRGGLTAPAVAAGDQAAALELALLVEDADPTADDAILALDLHQKRRLPGAPLWIAQKDAGLLPLIVEDHVEHTIPIKIHQADRLRVQNALPQSHPVGGVLEGAVTAIAEEAVGTLQATDHQIQMAVIVKVAPGGAGRMTREFGQVPGLLGHVAEAALAVILEQLRAAGLGDEQVRVAVV